MKTLKQRACGKHSRAIAFADDECPFCAEIAALQAKIKELRTALEGRTKPHRCQVPLVWQREARIAYLSFNRLKDAGHTANSALGRVWRDRIETDWALDILQEMLSR